MNRDLESSDGVNAMMGDMALSLSSNGLKQVANP